MVHFNNKTLEVLVSSSTEVEAEVMVAKVANSEGEEEVLEEAADMVVTEEEVDMEEEEAMEATAAKVVAKVELDSASFKIQRAKASKDKATDNHLEDRVKRMATMEVLAEVVASVVDNEAVDRTVVEVQIQEQEEVIINRKFVISTTSQEVARKETNSILRLASHYAISSIRMITNNSPKTKIPTTTRDRSTLSNKNNINAIISTKIWRVKI